MRASCERAGRRRSDPGDVPAGLPRAAALRGDSSARTWLLSIAHRTCTDELRQRARRRDTLAVTRPGAEPKSPDVAEQGLRQRVLHHLDPDRRAAFVLTQLIGLSYDEAAAVCGCPTGTIRSRFARARTDLIDLLTPDHGGSDTGAGHPR